MDGYEPHQDSTYALTLYRYNTEIEGKPVAVGADELFSASARALSIFFPALYLSSRMQIFGTRLDKSALTACILRTITQRTRAYS